MIVCPNCNHPNPDGAVQCEACYTPLPTTSNCSNCGATVQADAAFCGQCGFNLHSNVAPAAATSVATVAPDIPVELPQLVEPDPLLELLQPDALGINSDPNANQPAVPPLPPTAMSVPLAEAAETPPPAPIPTVVVQPVVAEPEPEPEPVAVPEAVAEPEPVAAPEAVAEPEPEPEPVAAPEAVAEPEPEPEPVAAAPTPVPSASMTQLQQVTARLFHVQSDREIELPQTLSVIHIGKPNDRIPPDVDVSGFSNSEIVSRIHADIRVEGDFHYVEDVGSSNGTYINNSPLLPGNRHRLRPGDRISLGKGDLVTFIFQLA
ncbi:FHA domain-containing protein [Nodularia sp. UHCC 0506]|uniref:FHA domain-containing protein n=1 Tax=Nodularia sp. UHCC 0506 TaxID=3110243 RepID=UPI002B214EFC|nr:FHA domain-containing protein [Nodularia sp. UHCC 0506]MEA5514162.1 FHA domain-containing protein [Nodularia sp. UHCC 0506]